MNHFLPRIAFILAMAVAFSGCWHEARFPLRVENQTDQEVHLYVEFMREKDNKTVWDKTFELPAYSPASDNPKTNVVLPTGKYILRATAGNLSEELSYEFGNSERSLGIIVHEDEIELSLTVV